MLSGLSRSAPSPGPADDPRAARLSHGLGLDRAAAAATHRYHLARFLILRLLGLVYLVAFAILIDQGLPLLGSRGLLPIGEFTARVTERLGSTTAAFSRLPSVLWFAHSDGLLQALAWCGALLALLVLLGVTNAAAMAVLWALYMSFVHVGQDWYGYGWEIQLLETGFLAIFLCPLGSFGPFPGRRPAPLVIGLLRWLIFRIMIGAGLIKLRGDPCWRDLTCLQFHYETQPNPNPFSRVLHFAPHGVATLGLLFNHVTELVVPWLLVAGRWATRVAGVFFVAEAEAARRCALEPLRRRRVRALTLAVLGALVAWLSVPVVGNLLSGRQVMNTSFGALDLVNTYGAFGTVGRERREIVFEGTSDSVPDAETVWREYPFKCAPCDPARRPCFITPYHYRLDWQMWFAAMGSPDRYPWTLRFVWKLLHNDPGTLSLLAANPFPDRPPSYVRARLYVYRFAPPGSG